MFERSTRFGKASIAMIYASAGCLVAAGVFGAVHIMALAIVFGGLLVVCGIAAVALAWGAYSRGNAEIDQLVRDEKARQNRNPNG
jgi:hypothetical protein